MSAMNIKEVDLSALEQMISLYPWYQQARVELILRLAEISKETASEKLHESYSFLPFPQWLAVKIEKVDIHSNQSEVDKEKVIQSEIQSARKIFVVGGDYFSREELMSVKSEDFNNDFSSPVIPVEAARKLEKEKFPEGKQRDVDMNSLIFYTETLAQIYTQQECWKEALDVYSKLILLYPEKSAYFANLIEEIKSKISTVN